MPRLPPLPNIRFDDSGIIHGDDFGDTYFSRDGGLAETNTVFLAGNNLPTAWNNKSSFVIGELGFGTGLNVLATWLLWKQTAPVDGTLHIITVEGFLLDAGAAAFAHKMWPELQELSQKLIARWPTRSFGTQRVWFDDDRVCITFLIGPCTDMLSRASFQADAWFLDGFAPSKNQDMWSPDIFAQVARLSKLGATLATYSVAGVVRAGLNEVGFDVRRMPGFGSKRERLEATFQPQSSLAANETPTRSRTAIVIGGGIGGAALCQALARRKIETQLIDADPYGATKASGNPVALIMPRLDRGDTREARFFRSAYLMAIDQYRAMPSGCFLQTGVLEFGEDEAALARLDDIMTDPPLPAHLLATSAEGALLHVTGGTVFPDLVLDYLKDGATRHPCRAERIERREDKWFVLTGDGAIIASADSCFIAAGTGIAGLCELGIELGARAGQLSLASIRGALPAKPVSSGGYAMAFNGRLSFGATFERWSIANQTPPPVSKEGHVHNLNLVHLFAPDLAGQIDLESAHGRASIRVTTPDNMPIAGPMPHHESGLYVLGALGSRGFTTSFLCAEHIVSHAFGEPSPMETSVASAISPDRFLNRKAKRKSVRATGPDTAILPSQQLD